MRRLAGILLFMVCSLAAPAQSFIIPYIAENGNSLKELTPKDWVIIREAKGFLNSDSLEDMAVVMEYKYTLAKNSVSKPRILVVITGQSGSNQYHVAAQNSDIVMREGESQNESIADPFSLFEIRKDTLVLGFNGGSERAWTIQYKFKNIKDQWLLVQTLYSLQVNGESTLQSWDFDFLKRCSLHSTYSVYDATHPISTQKKRISKPKALDQMGRPFTWEILPGVLI